MCMICIDLMKLSMTVMEAEKASDELVMVGKLDKYYLHYRKLNKSIKELDLEALGEAINEGTRTLKETQ